MYMNTQEWLGQDKSVFCSALAPGALLRFEPLRTWHTAVIHSTAPSSVPNLDSTCCLCLACLDGRSWRCEYSIAIQMLDEFVVPDDCIATSEATGVEIRAMFLEEQFKACIMSRV